MADVHFREIPRQDLPREKLTLRGAGALSDAELLAIFLRTGTKGKNVLQLAAELIRRHGTLAELARCSHRELMDSALGVGSAKAAELVAAFEIGKRLARSSHLRPKLDSPDRVYEVLGQEIQSLRNETVQVALLDTKLQLMRVEQISQGTVNETLAYARDVFRPALIYSAYAIIVLHNHPSGDPSPSKADIRITSRLKEASHLLEIPLKDHMIIGRPEGGREPYYSFAENGAL